RSGGEAAGLSDHRLAAEELTLDAPRAVTPSIGPPGAAPVMLGWFARDDTPVLVGQRVTLRAPRLADFSDWRTLRRESRQFLRPFEPRWSESDLSRRIFSARIRRSREEARAGTDYSFFIF